MTATPIVLLGIFERSGTNYLWDLFRAHPDCAVRRPVWEDKLLVPAQLLERYVASVTASWDERWEVPPDEADRLMRALGGGLVTWMREGVPAGKSHVIVKTPSVDNLMLADRLLPADARLLLLVRDGRSVVESGVRSFGWSYPVTMAAWAQAARTVVAATEGFAATGRSYHLVRYEDLVADQRGQLYAAFDYCGLDPQRYDFDAADALPVRGSSTVRAQADAPVEWGSVQRPDGFDPTHRHDAWDEALRHLYAELAGAAAAALGYPVASLEPPTRAVRAQLVRYRAELAVRTGQRQASRLRSRWRGRTRRAGARAHLRG